MNCRGHDAPADLNLVSDHHALFDVEQRHQREYLGEDEHAQGHPGEYRGHHQDLDDAGPVGAPLEDHGRFAHQGGNDDQETLQPHADVDQQGGHEHEEQIAAARASARA